MPILDHNRFPRRRPEDPKGPVETRLIQKSPFDITNQLQAETADGAAEKLLVSSKAGEGQIVSDTRAQDLLAEVLYELKHIRLHLEALTGENLRGDVDYADQ